MATPVDQLDLTHVTGHTLSLASIFGSFLGFIPAMAALAGFVWYMIQIYESETVQKKLERWRTLSKQRRLAKLQAEKKVLLAEIDALEVVREARAVATEKVAVAAHQATKALAEQKTKIEWNGPLE